MKIIIAPVFNESCFLGFSIPNWCNILEPDLIILNEGMFPRGSENRMKNSETFRKLYTSDGKRRSFDLNVLMAGLNEISKVFPNVDIQLNLMNYPEGCHTKEAYCMAYSYGLPKDLKSDDAIFIIEADLLLHEGDKEEIQRITKEHQPDDSTAMASFKRYFVSPFVRIYPDKIRRLFLKWGDGEEFHSVLSDLFHDRYQERGFVYPIRAFHYEWVRAAKYWDSRLEMFKSSLTKDMVEWHTHIKDTIYNNGRIPDGEKLHLDLKNSLNEDHPFHFRQHEIYKYFDIRRKKWKSNDGKT